MKRFHLILDRHDGRPPRVLYECEARIPEEAPDSLLLDLTIRDPAAPMFVTSYRLGECSGLAAFLEGFALGREEVAVQAGWLTVKEVPWHASST